MRKVILQEWLSLDCFVADKDGGLDFFANQELNKYSDDDALKFMDNIDTILLGRNTYELFVEFWPTATTQMEVIADSLNSTQKIVFSNSLTSAPWGKWPATKIIKGNLINEVKQLKSIQGKDMVLWGSISLAQELMKEKLIDEYQLRICPSVLGSGRQLFPLTKENTRLKLTDCKQ